MLSHFFTGSLYDLHDVETIVLGNEASSNTNNSNKSITIGKKLKNVKAKESEEAERPASSKDASEGKASQKKPHPLPHRISICIGGVPVLESNDLSTIGLGTCSVNQAETCNLDSESWGCKSLPNMIEHREDKVLITKSQSGFLEVPSLLGAPSEEAI